MAVSEFRFGYKHGAMKMTTTMTTTAAMKNVFYVVVAVAVNKSVFVPSWLLIVHKPTFSVSVSLYSCSRAAPPSQTLFPQ